MAIDDDTSLPLDPNMSPAYQWIAADARRRLAAGTLTGEAAQAWLNHHLPAIDNAAAEIRKVHYVN
jgi:hypothetical protein